MGHAQRTSSLQLKAPNQPFERVYKKAERCLDDRRIVGLPGVPTQVQCSDFAGIAFLALGSKPYNVQRYATKPLHSLVRMPHACLLHAQWLVMLKEQHFVRSGAVDWTQMVGNEVGLWRMCGFVKARAGDSMCRSRDGKVAAPLV